MECFWELGLASLAFRFLAVSSFDAVLEPFSIFLLLAFMINMVECVLIACLLLSLRESRRVVCIHILIIIQSSLRLNIHRPQLQRCHLRQLFLRLRCITNLFPTIIFFSWNVEWTYIVIPIVVLIQVSIRWVRTVLVSKMGGFKVTTGV